MGTSAELGQRLTYSDYQAQSILENVKEIKKRYDENPDIEEWRQELTRWESFITEIARALQLGPAEFALLTPVPPEEERTDEYVRALALDTRLAHLELEQSAHSSNLDQHKQQLSDSFRAEVNSLRRSILDTLEADLDFKVIDALEDQFEDQINDIVELKLDRYFDKHLEVALRDLLMNHLKLKVTIE